MIINTKVITKMVSDVVPFSQKKGTFNYVRLIKKNNKFNIMATNTNTLIIEKETLQENDETFDICVDGFKLLRLLKQIRENDIELKVGQELEIKDLDGHYIFDNIPSEEISILSYEQETPDVCIPSKDFSSIINKVVQSVADVDYMITPMSYMLFHYKNKYLNIVGSDGTEVSVYKLNIEHPTENERSYLIPRMEISRIVRLLSDGDVTFSFGFPYMRLDINNNITIMTLLGQKDMYPDYENITLKETMVFFSVDDKDQLINSISKINTMGDIIEMQPTDSGMKIKNQHAETFIKGQISSNDIHIGINGDKLLRAIKRLDTDHIQFEYAERHLLVLRDAHYQIILTTVNAK